MNAFLQLVRRALRPRQLAMTLAVSALAAVFVIFAATPVAAQNPACSTLIVGTRFSLPAMTVGQEAPVPAVPGAVALCVQGLEGPEGVAIKLEGSSPYTAEGNATPLAVDADFESSMQLPDPSFNGSSVVATPALPAVTVIALSDLSEGVTIWVGNLRPAAIAAPVMIDQWQDVGIPGNIGELKAGTTKWSGNGVTVKVTSGAAFTANVTAVMNEPGKLGEFELYVDGVAELKLAGTVPGQRFYLSVDPDTVTADNWLQRRVDPAAAASTGTPPVSGGGGGDEAPRFYRPPAAGLWLPLLTRQ